MWGSARGPQTTPLSHGSRLQTSFAPVGPESPLLRTHGAWGESLPAEEETSLKQVAVCTPVIDTKAHS